jgi:2,3-diketo-5-methylthio-1-phosphopentane phosphatase
MDRFRSEGTKIRAKRLPAPSTAEVWIDFDGTITRRDVLDDLILAYARDDSWKEVEELWQSGKIGSRECLSREFALVRISDAKLDAFLSAIDIDPGIVQLLGVLDRFAVPRAIVSDGIDRFIRHILARHALDAIPVRANTIERIGDDMRLACPFGSDACTTAAAHCKCTSIAEIGHPGKTSIYIGDGRSDLCPARKAGVVFAKGVLARHLANERRPFIPFVTLDDVAGALVDEWAAAPL